MTYIEMDYQERRINGIRAEQLAHVLFGGECQIAFKDGKRLEERCKGCVVIDIIRALPDGWQEAIEVKYFNRCPFRDPYDFAIALRTQLNKQKISMPQKVKQRVFVLCKGIDADILKEILVERLSKRIVIDVLEDEEVQE